MKKVILIEILSLKKKKTRGIRKKNLNCTCIRINTSKENFDVDCEASKIQTFISQFKDSKNKELKDEIEKLNLQLAFWVQKIMRSMIKNK